MWDEDELPEGDLESVYGREAVYTRLSTLIDVLCKKYEDTSRRLAALAQRQTQRDTPQQNTS